MCDGNLLEFVNLFLVFLFWGRKGVYSTKYYFYENISPNDERLPWKKIAIEGPHYYP
jgi:hypothetical protein